MCLDQIQRTSLVWEHSDQIMSYEVSGHRFCVLKLSGIWSPEIEYGWLYMLGDEDTVVSKRGQVDY